MLRNHRYSDLSMVMDSGGAIHAAAVVNGGIVYLANVTGTWVQMRLSAPLEEDEVAGGPSIGIDASGRMAVAYHRGKCGFMSCTPFQVFLVTNDSGEWSEERPIAGGDSPSLQLRDGVIHLTYKVSEGSSDVACPRPVPIRLMTSAGGDWQDVPVSTHGDETILEIGSDGLPRVMLGNYCGFLGDKGIYYATMPSATDPFVLEPIPGATPDEYGLVDMALGPLDRPQAIYRHFSDPDSEDLHLVLDDGGWTSAELVAPTLNVVSIATDPDGAAHLVAQGDTGTWYLTNRDGGFESEQISKASSVGSTAADIVVDHSGRPHMLFAVGGHDAVKPGLSYAVGPSQ